MYDGAGFYFPGGCPTRHTFVRNQYLPEMGQCCQLRPSSQCGGGGFGLISFLARAKNSYVETRTPGKCVVDGLVGGRPVERKLESVQVFAPKIQVQLHGEQSWYELSTSNWNTVSAIRIKASGVQHLYDDETAVFELKIFRQGQRVKTISMRRKQHDSLQTSDEHTFSQNETRRMFVLQFKAWREAGRESSELWERTRLAYIAPEKVCGVGFLQSTRLNCDAAATPTPKHLLHKIPGYALGVEYELVGAPDSEPGGFDFKRYAAKQHVDNAKISRNKEEGGRKRNAGKTNGSGPVARQLVVPTLTQGAERELTEGHSLSAAASPGGADEDAAFEAATPLAQGPWIKPSTTWTEDVAEAGVWKLVKKGAFCSQQVRKELSHGMTLSIEVCQAVAASDPECGPFVYGNGKLCRCVKEGQKCDFKKSKSGNSVFVLQASDEATPEEVEEASKRRKKLKHVATFERTVVEEGDEDDAEEATIAAPPPPPPLAAAALIQQHRALLDSNASLALGGSPCGGGCATVKTCLWNKVSWEPHQKTAWGIEVDLSVKPMKPGSTPDPMQLRGIPFELVSPGPPNVLVGQAGVNTALKVLANIRHMGAQAPLSAGLHLHVNVRNQNVGSDETLSMRQIMAVYVSWVRFQYVIDELISPDRVGNRYAMGVYLDWGLSAGGAKAIRDILQRGHSRLWRMLPEEDARLNQFEACTALIGTHRTVQWCKEDVTMNQAMRARLNPEKYFQINVTPLGRFGTIEFRAGSATLDPERAQRWFQFLVAFVHTFKHTDKAKHFFDDAFEEDLEELREAQRTASAAELTTLMKGNVEPDFIDYFTNTRPFETVKDTGCVKLNV